MAQSGTEWHSLAQNGTVWHRMAQFMYFRLTCFHYGGSSGYRQGPQTGEPLGLNTSPAQDVSMGSSHAGMRLDTGLNPVLHSRDPNIRPNESDFGVCIGKITTLKAVWHRMAQFGTVWHSLAQNGTVWHRLAQFGTEWHSLAQNDTVYVFQVNLLPLWRQ